VASWALRSAGTLVMCWRTWSPSVFEVDGAEADGLELAQDAGDFAGFVTQAPLAGEAGADPIGEEADAHMPEASGEDLALATVLDFEEAVGVAEFELGAGGEGFEGGVGEAGDEVEAFVFEGLEVDFAAHAAVKNEDGILDLKARRRRILTVLRRGGVGAVGSQ